ncbi:NAD(P)/FAD-dependent oxidoreductase [Haliscomenobacter sp.]|uniref:NAD(P)/FAD-dependent oxidoreductase n=1 Tax=Haliscomenobacter sp. TaxID=2717303 RepID=UPI0035943ED4
MNLKTDVCIMGAGPGGVATALKLSYLGIPCILVDKAAFPRDKICGDAISGKVTTLLNRLDPEIMQRFHAQPIQTDVWGVRFVAPNHKKLDIPFKAGYVRDEKMAPGYVSKRLEFDNFLIEEVQRRDNIQLLLETPIDAYERTTDGFRLHSKLKDIHIDCQLLIDASGAHSSFSRQYAGLEKDPKHHAAAVRAYYRNVSEIPIDNFIELHFIKSVTPGYFWIFALPNGEANVGIGMRSDIVKRRGVNLREELTRIIAEDPAISPRFKNAELIGKFEGYGLPLGSKTRHISGDHFMLVGDAGHLIDPLTGEGIGNAFYSGIIAAEQAVLCLQEKNFSEKFLIAYDVRIQRVLGSEMKLSYKMQQIGGNPLLLNFVSNIIDGNRKLLEYFSAMYTDFDLREKLVKPWFWIKMWLKKS